MGGGIEQKGKRTHGHGQQYDDCGEEWGIRGLSGTGKNTNIYIYQYQSFSSIFSLEEAPLQLLELSPPDTL